MMQGFWHFAKLCKSVYLGGSVCKIPAIKDTSIMLQELWLDIAVDLPHHAGVPIWT